MKGSLQDQLLKAGLADKGSAKQARAEKRKRQKQKKKAAPELSEAQLAAEKAAEEKRNKDKALNQAQQEEREKKALVAQIKQLIEVNRQSFNRGDVVLNFTDDNVVKRMYVTDAIHTLVVDARLAVVKYGADYALVPVPIADKIAERDSSFVVFRADDRPENEAKSEDDDWYAEYDIPDDLMW
ncbi:DUF2058 domain-containing protein [Alteromonas sp. 5E99-2]|uniref:DUF2058 domain-containing protein n=1 Tax=Alteromonas sp. 5E99-2 TaxID=2817683 RepID=UPI001A98CF60|nr:DUF2058 domain-containing protein [Alteromonas sp. 5E99-2]MBO1254950.1 DUF2058 domain-containing protein [Alteromonas sp. 5E99-2]